MVYLLKMNLGMPSEQPGLGPQTDLWRHILGLHSQWPGSVADRWWGVGGGY